MGEQKRSLPGTYPSLLETRHDLAVFQGLSGDPATAAAALARLVPATVSSPGAEDPFPSRVRVRAAVWRSGARDPDGAAADLEPLVAVVSRVLGPESEQTVSART
ncbi:hypothetical protein EAO69_22180 [Streptomyces sp. me109]|nr:hypothetical protein EAO69_22180 [Streptomyces sp. me109]